MNSFFGMKQGIDNIFHWFSNLATWVKVLSSVMVVVTWGTAIVTSYNNFIIQKHDKNVVTQINVSSAKIDRIMMFHKQDSLSIIDIINMQITLSENQVVISNQIKDVVGVSKVTKTLVLDHMANGQSADFILKIIQMYEDEKKNVSTSLIQQI